jgi:hypothetical protein
LRINASSFTVHVDTFGTAGVIQARYERHGFGLNWLFAPERFFIMPAATHHGKAVWKSEGGPSGDDPPDELRLSA